MARTQIQWTEDEAVALFAMTEPATEAFLFDGTNFNKGPIFRVPFHNCHFQFLSPKPPVYDAATVNDSLNNPPSVTDFSSQSQVSSNSHHSANNASHRRGKEKESQVNTGPWGEGHPPQTVFQDYPPNQTIREVLFAVFAPCNSMRVHEPQPSYLFFYKPAFVVGENGDLQLIPETAAPLFTRNELYISEVMISFNSSSTAALIFNQSEDDKSNVSYYGDTNVYHWGYQDRVLRRISVKNQPVADVKWSPTRDEFIIIQGHTNDAHSELWDARPDVGIIKRSVLTKGYRNTVRWSPFGSCLVVGGYANLAGDTDFFYRDRDKKAMIKSGSVNVHQTVLCEWCPSGKYFLTSAIFPRRRVDNCIKIFDTSGMKVGQTKFEELYNVEWQPPNFLGEFSDPGRPTSLVENVSGDTLAAPSKGKYIPPSQRLKMAAQDSAPASANSLAVSAGASSPTLTPTPISAVPKAKGKAKAKNTVEPSLSVDAAIPAASASVQPQQTTQFSSNAETASVLPTKAACAVEQPQTTLEVPTTSAVEKEKPKSPASEKHDASKSTTPSEVAPPTSVKATPKVGVFALRQQAASVAASSSPFQAPANVSESGTTSSPNPPAKKDENIAPHHPTFSNTPPLPENTNQAPFLPMPQQVPSFPHNPNTVMPQQFQPNRMPPQMADDGALQNRIRHLSKICATQPVWEYQDPSGRVQKGFTLRQMREWHVHNFFSDDLPVKIGGVMNDFVPVRIIYPDKATRFDFAPEKFYEMVLSHQPSPPPMPYHMPPPVTPPPSHVVHPAAAMSNRPHMMPHHASHHHPGGMMRPNPNAPMPMEPNMMLGHPQNPHQQFQNMPPQGQHPSQMGPSMSGPVSHFPQQQQQNIHMSNPSYGAPLNAGANPQQMPNPAHRQYPGMQPQQGYNFQPNQPPMPNMYNKMNQQNPMNVMPNNQQQKMQYPPNQQNNMMMHFDNRVPQMQPSNYNQPIINPYLNPHMQQQQQQQHQQQPNYPQQLPQYNPQIQQQMPMMYPPPVYKWSGSPNQPNQMQQQQQQFNQSNLHPSNMNVNPSNMSNIRKA
eukprot:GDKJ01009017.1.p1 GENE.GDKJ01009017.1~~GDKJ01009017.1.p1  ORF type:complete len:1055 (+),score=299.82 GDKJ01009017.1:2-3166(+)